MNDYQISTKSSYKLIVNEAKNDAKAVSLIPTFAKGINRLEEITDEMDLLAVQQAKDLKGITKDKKNVLEELIDYTIDVAGAIHSYAETKNNLTLQTKVNFKISQVSTMNQEEVINAAAITLEEAGKLPADALAEEGITAEELTQFTELYNQFKDTKDGKRKALIERINYTDRLSELFAEAANLKKNKLDRLATQFQRKAPEFYLKYKAAATVIYKRSAKKTDTPTQETK